MPVDRTGTPPLQPCLNSFSLSFRHSLLSLENSNNNNNNNNIKLATKYDATLSRVLDYVRRGWPSLKEVPSNVQPYVQHQTELSVEIDCLLWGTRVVIPKSLQDTLLKSLHDNHVHPGITRLKAVARSYF